MQLVVEYDGAGNIDGCYRRRYIAQSNDRERADLDLGRRVRTFVILSTISRGGKNRIDNCHLHLAKDIAGFASQPTRTMQRLRGSNRVIVAVQQNGYIRGAYNVG